MKQLEIKQPTVEETVRRLADMEAIRDLARRYADGVWRRDVSAAVGLFAEDGVMEVGDAPPIVGRAALLEAYQAMLTTDLQPFVHNHVIELDGDRAVGRCYLDLRATRDGVSMMGSGHYEDVYVPPIDLHLGHCEHDRLGVLLGGAAARHQRARGTNGALKPSC